jgi:hypothetical protein
MFMKKMVFCIIPLIVIMGCASSSTPAVATNGGSSRGMDLDAAIKEAAVQMEANLPGQTKVALVSAASSSVQLSEYIISRLEAALVGGKKLVVVDRANLDRIREEQGFQLSGEVNDESAKAIGQLLGAGAIVTGSFTDLGDVYSLTLKAINMETAAVAASYPADIAKTTRIETLLASGGGAKTQTVNTGGNTIVPAAVPGQSAAQTPATPPAPAYRVGGAGPAGGIIFYDKGSNSGGWRYLEAAPSEAETFETWGPDIVGPNYYGVAGTQTGTGTGKANTGAVAASHNRVGTPQSAAQFCETLTAGGYDDWFLPSKDELNLMYTNLHAKGLGNFQYDWYWSSSQGDNDGAPFRPWAQIFSNGGQDRSGQTNKYCVRPIRSF